MFLVPGRQSELQAWGGCVMVGRRVQRLESQFSYTLKALCREREEKACVNSWGLI